MTRNVAFLRGMNVGGHRIKMDRLRVLLESLGLGRGLGGVETFIASGNVVFDSHERDPPVLEREIEEYLYAQLEYEVGTFIRPVEDLGSIISFGRENSGFDSSLRAHVMFLKASPEAGVQKAFDLLETADDVFRVWQREVFWVRVGGIGRRLFNIIPARP